MVEAALVLEAQGKVVVAPFRSGPPMVLGAMPIGEFGSESLRTALLPSVVSGTTVLTAALTDVAGDLAVGGEGRPSVAAERRGAGGVALTGVARAVPFAHVADRVLVPGRPRRRGGGRRPSILAPTGSGASRR